MRIGTKLLVTYLALISLVAVATVIFLPRWVQAVVMMQEQQRLQEQAEGVATQLARRVRPGTGGPSAGGPRSGGPPIERNLQDTLRLVDTILTDESVVVVNTAGLVLDSNRVELRGAQIAIEPLIASRGRHRSRSNLSVAGVGTVLAAVAPIASDGQLPAGLSVVIFRQITYVEQLTRGLTRWFLTIILLVLVAALLVVGWVSRDLVRRLQETGRAARSLAEGDLDQRAPERGTDEIAEMAGHFNHMAERLQALVQGLRRSEASRKALLAVASHEIRTPLTSIHGFAEALRDGVVPTEERRQRYYQIIATESERLNHMVEELFDVTKLEAGQAELQLQELAVGPWLSEFTESYRPPEGVQMELAVAPEAAAAHIYGDRERLRQVLNNLVSNAARFSPAGESVRLEGELEDDDLLIRVVDRGPGLTPEEAEHVFQRFYQGQNQGGRSHKGAGLGLAIVKSLVEAHGGSVGVTSQPGQGATFWFRIKQIEQG